MIVIPSVFKLGRTTDFILPSDTINIVCRTPFGGFLGARLQEPGPVVIIIDLSMGTFTLYSICFACSM